MKVFVERAVTIDIINDTNPDVILPEQSNIAISSSLCIFLMFVIQCSLTRKLSLLRCEHGASRQMPAFKRCEEYLPTSSKLPP